MPARQWIEVLPAYGRDYTNQKSVKADWDANKDFIETVSGSATNKADAEAMGLGVIVRYAKQLKVMQVTK